MSYLTGLVITTHGRHYIVELPDHQIIRCYPKGKKSQACVGDWVNIDPQQPEWIMGIQPRRNLFYRSDTTRSRQFAANIDQILIVIATQPTFSMDLVGRAITAALAADIEPIIVLNKCDLKHQIPLALAQLSVYAERYQVIQLSAYQPDTINTQLLPVVKDKTSLLIGQSGMGKSSILNVLVPTAQSQTQEISHALDSGKHTTTHSTLYHLPHHQGNIIDTPGFQSFGLEHLSIGDICHAFPEFTPFLEHCRFYNCTHTKEPQCGVKQALAQGMIDPLRYELYQRLLQEKQ